MKCSLCYSDNPGNLRRCSVCGGSTSPIEFCARGHILDPDSGLCTVCPFLWPDVEPFEGPAVLRGILWLERGEFLDREGATAIPFVELRDGPLPVAVIEEDGALRVDFSDSDDASIKVLTRPAAIAYCLSARLHNQAGSAPAYRDLGAADRIWLGETLLRVARFEVPAWAGRVVGSRPE